MSRARLSQLLSIERLAVAPRPLSDMERRRIARALGMRVESLFPDGKR